ncbi:hypothetical protein B0A52_05620 [Exophiala mesophila]|uniref:Uncharacterized protein n=1 Tax=Exophiala mesophila TaxID=212818 RepID=A0A438N3G8_EXOME|nr:hypothetical protein B0A52_05620 [Exophiala mesophila]
MSSSNPNLQNTTSQKVERTTNSINTKDDKKDESSQASKVNGGGHQHTNDVETVTFSGVMTQEVRRRIGLPEQK